MRTAIARTTALTLGMVATALAQKTAVDLTATRPQVHLDLGLFTDLYGDKVLIEFIDRGRYPVTDFPFQPGDELVSIGGVAVSGLITDQQSTATGSSAYQRRLAADALTYPLQSRFTGPSNPAADVIIRRAGTGALEFYRLEWLASGYRTAVQHKPTIPTHADTPDIGYLEERQLQDENGQWISRNDTLGWGRPAPYFNLPANFQTRRGSTSSDNLYSGTFEADGKRIGYPPHP